MFRRELNEPPRIGVHHLNRKVVGRRARHADPADADLRLRRARLVDQVRPARRAAADAAGSASARPQRRDGFHAPNCVLEQRQHRVWRDVADDEQRRVVRPERRLRRTRADRPA